jgi:hypothetical protein
MPEAYRRVADAPWRPAREPAAKFRAEATRQLRMFGVSFALYSLYLIFAALFLEERRIALLVF